MIQNSRRPAVALVVAALAVLVAPPLLFAHAHLVRSTPSANSTATAVPDIRLWFSETPELRFTHVRLIALAGSEVTLGPPTSGTDMSIVVPVTRALAAGRYKVEWHTAAADGHSSAGIFEFSVRDSVPAAAPVAPPATHAPVQATRPTAQSNAPIVVEGDARYAAPLRWAEFVALLTFIGLAIFRLSISRDAKWTDDVAADSFARALTLARALLVLFAITTITRGMAEANMLGMTGSRIQSLQTLVQFTRWGFGWSVGVVGVLVAAVGLSIAGRGAAGWVIASVGIVAMTLGEALTGHSAVTRNAPLALAADVAHQLGAGGWLGGLVAVLLCGLPALKRLGDAERAAAGSRLLRAYHGAALECVSIVIASAILATWLRLPRLAALWTSDYGSMLLRKLFFVVILLLFGFYHWRRVVVPDWTDSGAGRFRRTAVAELVIGAVVLAITALLVSTSLPT